MLILSNISKRYGPKVLFRGVSLRLARGERMGLVGPNGAGKTTLFSILLGKNQEDEGIIEWERGIRIGAQNETKMRAVTHLDVSNDDIQFTLTALRDILA